MYFGVFIHRHDSRYDDHPSERYQFPKSYLSRATNFVKSWVLYYEPTKVKNSRGYYAVARIEKIIPDPTTPNMHLALIEQGSYLEFSTFVPFAENSVLLEKGLYNEAGKISGRAQAAIRPISLTDFNTILERGLQGHEELLPRETPLPDTISPNELQEDQAGFDHTSRTRIAYVGNRLVRNKIFRKTVLNAYDERCAITGLRFINGGGRAEVQAAHIRPVSENGPDAIQNGIALSGTVHWMFDRGLLSLSNDLEIMVSRQINDRDSIDSLIYPSGFAREPVAQRYMPHPKYLKWHRENCFKH